MSPFLWDDPAARDSLGFSQTTRKEPLVIHWLIEPEATKPANKGDASKENRPSWKITAQLEAPADWTLATASSGTSVIERISSQPLILSFPFQERFPPLGPGPSLDTQWKTPGGPVFFRLEPEMSLAAVTEIPPEELAGPPRPSNVWAIAFVAILFVFVWLLSRLWRQTNTFKLARAWHQSAPSDQAPWSEWEQWLAHVEREWKAHAPQNQKSVSLAWRELGQVLPLARFGRPRNPALADTLGKIKILGSLDSLVKLDAVGGR